MSNQKQSYPLTWPDGWKRTPAHQRKASRFLKPVQFGSRHWSMSDAVAFLSGELDKLGASKQVLSTNVRIRLDGKPYSQQAQPTDTGAATYFELKGKPVSLACDKWNRVEDNVLSIAKHIQAMRGQDRWGVGNIKQAFRGYMALPAIGESEASTWWQVLGVSVNASVDQVKEAYRILVKKHHPDRPGGDPEMFQRLQRAMERFERHLKDLEEAA